MKKLLTALFIVMTLGLFAQVNPSIWQGQTSPNQTVNQTPWGTLWPAGNPVMLPPVPTCINGLNGGTVSLGVNSSIVLYGGTIAGLTLSFPAGVTGNYIQVTFVQNITTITYAGTTPPTLPAAGVVQASKTYTYQNGVWN